MKISFVFLKFVKFVNLFLLSNLIIWFSEWEICGADKLPNQPLPVHSSGLQEHNKLLQCPS